MPYRLFCVGCCLLGLSEWILHSATLHPWDITVVEWVSQYRIHALNSIATLLSQLGSMSCVLLLTLFWCLHQARYRQYGHVIFISLGILGSSLMGWLLKWWIARPRPQEMYHLVNSYGDSFPSVHSVYAATLACLAILIFDKHRSRAYIIWFAVLWLLLMGTSRVYLGVHYPTDVLAGWSIGLIWISLLWLGLRPQQFRQKQIHFR